MTDAAELEFLRCTLVEPGFLASDRLDAWRSNWPGRGSFFAHLVELGALARPDAGTLSAVFKGYVKLPPAGLLGLFKLDARPVAVVGPARPERPVAVVGPARPERPAAPGSADMSSASLWDSEATARSSPALRAAVDAALSGLPMELEAGLFATAAAGVPLGAEPSAGRALPASEDMFRGTGEDRI